ncbi:MAG: permease-like cell division protein FtsX [Gammaproteobacteria bacterium SHHR-1]|uniref:permease-like cell division protein FtsX n=1 Tax=Magnetovirga frankeli TaxID=947516 RepID=UPI0012931201|nr:FtsX-like permease family protein [gamma proteobacterium SS-5]
MTSLLREHLAALRQTLSRLARQPGSSLMTLGVIAITLALPAGLHLVLDSAQGLSRHWAGGSSISAFLKPDLNAAHGARLLHEIQALEGVEQAQLLTQEEALTEFSLFSGFDEALGLLEENPLPMVVLIRPDPALTSPEPMEQLLTQLRQEPQIEHVVLDLEWVRRLAAITETASRVVLLLWLLLGLAVVLVIGNTIRLEIRNRQEEIILIKQVGGSDAFVRRPFLYTGLCYGLFGGLGAWLLILLAAVILEGPITELASLYQSDYRLALFNLQTLGLLLLGGPLLGLLGAWSASGQHLRTED